LAVVDDGTQLRARIRGKAFDDDLFWMIVRIGLGDIGRDFHLLQFFFHQLHRMIRLSVYRVIDLYFEDQVRAALEVQTQADAFEQALLERVEAHAVGNAKNTVDKDQQDAEDE